MPDIPTSIPLPGELVLLMDSLQDSPVSAVKIKKWTDHDPLVSRIWKCILQGWPDLVEEDFQPYYQKRTELTIQDGFILWASRVVVPTVGHSKSAGGTPSRSFGGILNESPSKKHSMLARVRC